METETPKVRVAMASDMPEMGSLLGRYMGEFLGRPWEGSAAELRDGLGRDFHAVIACTGYAMVGFAVWHNTYDVHHCLPGGEISDMYVLPQNRGKGIAPTLIAMVASQVLRTGGRFVKGRIDKAAEPFYRKVAIVCEGSESYISGRAFRTLAGRAEAVPQRTIRRFPALSENFEQ